jgi:mono/diheme cytochrome c family protein
VVGIYRDQNDAGSIPTAFVLSLLLSVPLMAQTSASVGSEPDSVAAGRALFLGTVRFQNGGPACSACHSVAGLAFPKGGTMGPDLTGVYSKMGPEGLNSALETLFFPAMTPLFRYRPLTSNERQDLAALFESTDRQQPATPTLAIGAISLAGFFILIAVTGIAGRHRVRSVRSALLERARVRTGPNR